ncbi:MerR family transcriptional regulator [Altererythrobacter sp. Root672]|uniref:MerR family transcriptional regulator n=1 Tax=Altererythrobacter sp. Root672 TaxID=1736584 RepID=UPI0006FCE5D6|nr:MerR family transcriptional regulator [Altererythrobacter sp. Root672]KRA81484.1 MerR family transcriptional regulator [Altererythrobacter sp. Root672]
MHDSLDIAEVARLTGLTLRALRFYEGRGLVTPLRTASGRRHYGPAQLERLHQIVAMKRAGLTLAQIHSMTAGRHIDLRHIVVAQIETLADREREVANTRTVLESILSRIDRSEPIDVATFCSLIRQGETIVTKDKWDELTSRYMATDQKEAFQQSVAALPADFDNEAHNAKWKDLSDRINAALPMDPASPQAQAFLDEWDEMIRPFLAVASPEMLEGVKGLHENIESWEGDVASPFDAEAYRFHQRAAEAREAMRR